MAKLTLIELTNSSQIFGKSEYAMFLAQTSDNQIVECGITYNSLNRAQFDTDALDSLLGCQIVTKEYTDSITGELVNPEDRIQMILDGDAKLVLFNSINSRVRKSELYTAVQKEQRSSLSAKVKVEFLKEKKQSQMQKSLERAQARAMTIINVVGENKPTESLDDDDEIESLDPETATAETSELGF